MFLKSLELNGFKSFASKTVLEFPAGITAIVGPNGSGKSNIIDCIRWLLGERDAKSLRGGKTEDLIWNGTPKRPRVGMAQAGLNFDNGSGFFPVDFKEVSVSRRVGRDGNSQYFLNKSEVRLKDIIDFMSRSRLGTKGLTVIGQGSSDLFVRVSPEERRAMIEEILGLREYQLKKSEAERKLKNTFFNLEKVKAMTEEVLPRLRLLKRQTNKWSKRAELLNELKKIENDYFSFKFQENKSAEQKIKPSLDLLENEIFEKQKYLKSLELEIKKIDSKPQEYEEVKRIKREQSELFSERSRIEKELGRLEGKLEFLSSASEENKVFRNDDLLNLINEIKKSLEGEVNFSDFEKLKKFVNDLIKKIDDFLNPLLPAETKSKELSEFEKVKSDLSVELSSLEEKIKEYEKQEVKISANLEDFNKQFQKSFELVEEKREELRKLEEGRNRFLFEKERLSIKLGEILNKLDEIGRDKSEFNIQEAPEINNDDLANMEKRMFRLRAELASMGDIDETLIKEAEEVEKHYNFLKNQSEDLEKAAEDLKKLIKDLTEKIHSEFNSSLKLINEEFGKFFKLMFGGGSAKLKVERQKPKVKIKDEAENNGGEKNEISEESDEGEKFGVEIDLNLPKKRITGLEMLSGGEKSLVSIAALFSMIAVSPPPFLVLDEIDAPLDESNSKRFSSLVREFSKKTQFIIATHNRATMEAANILYGVTMGEDGASKVISLKLDNPPA